MFKKCSYFIVLVFLSFIAFQLIYPDVSKLKIENPKRTAFMEHKKNEWEKQGKKNIIKQIWVPYSSISPYLIKAVIIAEDDKFWKHNGFDYEAMEEALEKNIKSKKIRVGGSTITQQLAKNLYLSPSKNPLRKIREAIIAWRLERTLSKKRILELYLNVAEWGDKGIFGIEAASIFYFGKSAKELTPSESSRLASILPNPKIFNPLGNSRYVLNRSNRIYKVMQKRGMIVQ